MDVQGRVEWTAGGGGLYADLHSLTGAVMLITDDAMMRSSLLALSATFNGEVQLHGVSSADTGGPIVSVSQAAGC